MNHIPNTELPVLFEDYKPEPYKAVQKKLVAPVDWTLECRSGSLRLLISESEKAWSFMEDMKIPCTGLLNQTYDVYELSPEQLKEFIERLGIKRQRKTKTKIETTPAQRAARRVNARKARERKRKT